MTSLTDEQQIAIDCPDREIVVLAGAGSGKTTVLTHRITRLLEEGFSGHRILALTFTTAAAQHMRQKLIELIGGNEDDDLDCMLIGTFHSIALHILRQDADRIGYDEQKLTVIEPTDADLLLEMVAKELGYWKRRGMSARGLRGALDGFYNTGTMPIGNLKTVIEGYHERLKQWQLLDFGMILIECRRLLRIKVVLDYWQQRIAYVLVDELQDEDEVQYDLHMTLCAGGAHFFGVGDYRQSIYGWRGARPELIDKLHGSATLLHLRQTFRCREPICEAANNVSRHQGDDRLVDMFPAAGHGECRVLAGRRSDIVDAIGGLRYAGYDLNDVAVLVRQHRHAQRIQDALEEAGIPTRRVGAEMAIASSPEFLWILACLRLAVNPNDRLAALRLEKFPKTVGGGLSADQPVILAIDSSSAHIYASGVYESESLMKIRQWWRQNCPNPVTITVREALDWWTTVRIDGLIAKKEPEGGPPQAVTISTIHGAKGCEWKAGVLAELNDGTLPSSQSLRAEDVREERNVFYVGLTRFAEIVILHYRRHEDQAVDRRPQEPSRFLTEVNSRWP